MIDATTWKYLVDNWPQLTSLAVVVVMAVRAHTFIVTQHLSNRRVRKLMKLHSKKHEADGAYLYDDSVD